jgi:hypothetical protein
MTFSGDLSMIPLAQIYTLDMLRTPGVAVAEEVDLTGLSQEQLFHGLADMVLSFLRRDRVVVLFARADGAVTFVNPTVFQDVPAERLAQSLLESWSEEDVSALLEHIYG